MTLYATLGEDAIVHGINQSEVEVVITDGHLLTKLLAVAAQLRNIKTIIYIGDVNLSGLSGFPGHVKVLSMAEVEKIGYRSQNSKHTDLHFGDFCTLRVPPIPPPPPPQLKRFRNLLIGLSGS